MLKATSRTSQIRCHNATLTEWQRDNIGDSVREASY